MDQTIKSRAVHEGVLVIADERVNISSHGECEGLEILGAGLANICHASINSWRILGCCKAQQLAYSSGDRTSPEGWVGTQYKQTSPYRLTAKN